MLFLVPLLCSRRVLATLFDMIAETALCRNMPKFHHRSGEKLKDELVDVYENQDYKELYDRSDDLAQLLKTDNLDAIKAVEIFADVARVHPSIVKEHEDALRYFADETGGSWHVLSVLSSALSPTPETGYKLNRNTVFEECQVDDATVDSVRPFLDFLEETVKHNQLGTSPIEDLLPSLRIWSVLGRNGVDIPLTVFDKAIILSEVGERVHQINALSVLMAASIQNHPYETLATGRIIQFAVQGTPFFSSSVRRVATRALANINSNDPSKLMNFSQREYTKAADEYLAEVHDARNSRAKFIGEVSVTITGYPNRSMLGKLYWSIRSLINRGEFDEKTITAALNNAEHLP